MEISCISYLEAAYYLHQRRRTGADEFSLIMTFYRVLNIVKIFIAYFQPCNGSYRLEN